MLQLGLALCGSRLARSIQSRFWKQEPEVAPSAKLQQASPSHQCRVLRGHWALGQESQQATPLPYPCPWPTEQGLPMQDPQGEQGGLLGSTWQRDRSWGRGQGPLVSQVEKGRAGRGVEALPNLIHGQPPRGR